MLGVISWWVSNMITILNILKKRWGIFYWIFTPHIPWHNRTWWIMPSPWSLSSSTINHKRRMHALQNIMITWFSTRRRIWITEVNALTLRTSSPCLRDKIWWEMIVSFLTVTMKQQMAILFWLYVKTW